MPRSWMRRACEFSLVCLTLILIVGCSSGVVVRNPLEPGSSTPEKILKLNNSNADKFKSLKGISSLTIESPNFANKVSARIVFKRPDSLYIKIEGLLGVDAAKISFNANDFVLYNILENQVVTGKTNSSSIRKMVDLDFEFEEIVSVFTGLVRLRQSHLDSLIEFTIDDTYYLMVSRHGDLTVRHWIDPYSGYAISRVVIEKPDGEVEFEKDFSRFEKQSGVWIPKYVRFLNPGRKEQVSLLYRGIKINDKIEEKTFQFKVPDKAKRIIFD